MKKFRILIPSICILIVYFIFFIAFPTNNASINSDILKVHYINVGQGDSILIQDKNYNILIDSGPKESQSKILSYLDNLNISSIDYLIATHPHEDHIDNMSSIIYKYDVKNFYAPKIVNKSKPFEQMVEALIYKNLKINTISSETASIYLNDNFYIEFYGPSKSVSDENLNLYSAIFKVVFNSTSFLFTGDAEESCEHFILSQNYNLNSNVLKVGHHGSSTSTSKTFLDAVNPSIAIISCGIDNIYNHPSPDVVNLLNELNIETYRTDIHDDIVIISDGDKLYKESLKR